MAGACFERRTLPVAERVPAGIRDVIVDLNLADDLLLVERNSDAFRPISSSLRQTNPTARRKIE